MPTIFPVISASRLPEETVDPAATVARGRRPRVTLVESAGNDLVAAHGTFRREAGPLTWGPRRALQDG